MVNQRIGLVILGATLLAAAPAHANATARARAHFDAGSRLYQQGHYDQALDELTAGYNLDPRPEFLYSLGQVQRRRGHCSEALTFYRRYLETGLPRARAAAVLVQVDRCRAELERQAAPPEPSPVVPPPVVPPPVIARPPSLIAPPPAAVPILTAPAPARRTPVYKRWYIWTPVALVAVAGAGIAVWLTVGRASDFKPTLPDVVVK
jgi:hypothetical protein